MRERLDAVLPELAESNARELAEEIARGTNITIPEKQMEENIVHNLKVLRRQNEINEASITNNSPSCIQDTTRGNRKRKRRDNDSGRHRAETIREDIKSNIRRRAGEEINRAYGHHRDHPEEYEAAKQPILSRVGKKNIVSREQSIILQQARERDEAGSHLNYEVREEDYEDFDEISESDSDDPYGRRGQPRGGQ